MNKRILLSLAICTIAVGLLNACTKNKTDNKETANTQIEATKKDEMSEGNSIFPIEIEHVYGKTIIEKKPERIATLAWGNHDAVLALGIAPVGVSKANFGVSEEETLLPWTKEAFNSLGVSEPNVYDDTDGFDYEAINDSNPDVLLAPYSGISKEEYDKLSEITKVVPYKDAAWQTAWREQTLVISESLGMSEEGKKLINETEELIANKLKEYEIPSKKAAFAYINPTDFSQIYIYLPKDARAAYLNDLGFEVPESIRAMANSDFYVLISAEEADKLTDIELLFTYGDQKLLEDLQKDKLLSVIPAISKSNVVLLDNSSALAASCTPSVLSIRATIDEYLSLIKEAINK